MQHSVRRNINISGIQVFNKPEFQIDFLWKHIEAGDYYPVRTRRKNIYVTLITDPKPVS